MALEALRSDVNIEGLTIVGMRRGCCLETIVKSVANVDSNRKFRFTFFCIIIGLSL